MNQITRPRESFNNAWCPAGRREGSRPRYCPSVGLPDVRIIPAPHVTAVWVVQPQNRRGVATDHQAEPFQGRAAEMRPLLMELLQLVPQSSRSFLLNDVPPVPVRGVVRERPRRPPITGHDLRDGVSRVVEVDLLARHPAQVLLRQLAPSVVGVGE